MYVSLFISWLKRSHISVCLIVFTASPCKASARLRSFVVLSAPKCSKKARVLGLETAFVSHNLVEGQGGVVDKWEKENGQCGHQYC